MNQTNSSCNTEQNHTTLILYSKSHLPTEIDNTTKNPRALSQGKKGWKRGKEGEKGKTKNKIK